MAYVHCHNCNWQQDDFWSFRGYNPLRFFLKNDLPWLWKPRWIAGDREFLRKGRIASFFTRVQDKVWTQPENGPKCADKDGNIVGPTPYKEYSQHSWFMLAWAATHKVKRLFTQRWWTYEAWRHDCEKGIGDCPKCGKSLCID